MDSNNFGNDPGLSGPVSDNPTALAIIDIPPHLLALDEKGKQYIKVDMSQLSASGAEALPIDRLQLPKLKLLNSTSGEVSGGTIMGARAGLWFNDMSAELHEDINIIPLHVKVTRYCYPPGSLSDRVCMSLDGRGEFGITKKTDEELKALKLQPIPRRHIVDNGREFMAGDCAMCKNKEFSEDGQKPTCQKVTWVYGVYAALLDEQSGMLDEVERALTSPSDLGEILGMCFGIGFRSTDGENCVGKIRNTAIFTGGIYTQVWRLFSGQRQQKNGPNRWYAPEVAVISKLSDRQKRVTNSLRHIVSSINPIFSLTEVEDSQAAPPPMEPGAEEVNVD